MTFERALQVLAGFQRFGMRPGLDTTRALAARVGHPERGLRFIHVAGTNGKGSTCAMLESIYRAAGYRTGLYTSPHLIRFGERIQIQRQLLSEVDAAALVDELLPHVEGLEVTFFEFATVMALMHFARQGVDVVIWETGLGGRWDATNIVEPLASVVTNIGWDHQQWLGDTLPKIAGEKAGIYKPGVPAITGVRLGQRPGEADTGIEGAWEVLRARAVELGCEFVSVDDWEREWASAGSPVVRLPGVHQRHNAAVALATVRVLQRQVPVGLDAIRTGLGTVEWMGRLQSVRRGSATWWLDGAHNRPGIEALLAALPEAIPGSAPALLLGVLADKDWGAMCAELARAASRIVVAPVASTRGADPESLAAACRAANPAIVVETSPSVAAAMDQLRLEPRVLVTGSLYFLGEILERLESDSCRGEAGTDGTVGSGLGQRGLNEWKPASG